MRLKQALNIDDLRRMAKARLPRMVFDYIDGGADDEVTLKHSVSRYDDYQLTWRALRDVTKIDTSTTIMRQATKFPFFISPTATTRLFHPAEGELALARAAEARGVIYACSTLASQTVEDIAQATSGPKWVQLYVWKDKKIVRDFLARAKDAGFAGCILTVDLPVPGNRERDPRNSFSIPPKPNLSLARQLISKPRWAWDMVRSPAITPANFSHLEGQSDQGGLIGFVNAQFSRAVTWADVEWMREFWGPGFAIKGISRAEDAKRAVELGADAVWISNHGGRQLDTSVPTIDLLPEIVDAVRGRADIIADGGVR
ncbi:MAG: alpha-hydroxy acid oxidase, partial [Henriciella sp.]|uniref:alpha-hydroxy acid oxidase n=1 Tax=Henriciella sp. TaxID=1968823 RepID=UPI003C75E765